MRSFAKLLVFGALMMGAAYGVQPAAAVAGGLDGIWSVLIITEKGDCDSAYRYEVKVANGHVSYAGDASLDMNGTVTPSGLVKVSIRPGSKAPRASAICRGRAGLAPGTAPVATRPAPAAGKRNEDKFSRRSVKTQNAPVSRRARDSAEKF